MMIFIIIIHVIICIALIGMVLIQRGRGSGLVESFSGVESMFGTKTNTFLTRTTTILSILFFFTCLSLAVLSVRQSRSLMRNIKTEPTQGVSQPEAAKQEMPKPEMPKQEPPKPEEETPVQTQIPPSSEKPAEAPKTE